MPILAIFLIIVQAIFLLAHWFVFRTIVDFFSLANYPGAVLGLEIFFGLASISFLAASVLGFKYRGAFAKILYRVSSYWLVLFYFLLIASALCWIIFGFWPTPVPAFDLAGWLFGAALVAAIWSIINAANPRIARIQISLPNLPDHWRGKKFAWASDLHLGMIYSEGIIKKLVEVLRKEQPEFLVIGGDLYDGGDTDQEEAKKILNELDLPQGKYFITGNHEQFRHPEYFFEHVKDFGLRILLNENLDLQGLQLVGVDYYSTRHEQNFQETLAGLKINPDHPSILLKHEPTHVPVAAEHGISLQISGHTHNGQMWPFGLLAKLMYKGFNYGLKNFGKTWVYVSSGAGTWGPPGRFLTKSEIVIFELR